MNIVKVTKGIIAFAILSCAALVTGQTSVSPLLQPRQSFLDRNGTPCVQCRLWSYQAGTTTIQYTYTDSTGTTQNPDPIILDSSGSASVWPAAGQSYKYVLTNPAGAVIWTQDHVTGPQQNLGFTPVNKAGDTMTGNLHAPQVNAGNTIVLADGTAAVNAQAYATGDGVTDDAAALRTADAQAATLKVPLWLPKQYLIKSPVPISAPKWDGVPGQTQIIIGSAFVYNTAQCGTGGAWQGAIYNTHCSKTFNSATADKLDIEGITFVNNAPCDSNSQRETLMLLNDQGSIVKNDTFTSSGTCEITDFDVYGPSQNLTVSGITDVQNTGASAGGCFWILGLGTGSADVTQNVHVSDYSCTYSSADEAFATESASSPIKDVFFNNITINLTGTAAPNSNFTIFGNGSSSPCAACGTSNIHASNVNIYTSTTGFYPVRIGVASEAVTPSNVFLDGFTEQISSTNSTMQAGIYNLDGQQVYITNPNLNSTGNSVTVAAILGQNGTSSTFVTGGTIKGVWASGVASATNVIGTTINLGTNGTGISTVGMVEGATITANTGIDEQAAGTYTLRGNTITIPNGAAAFNACIAGHGASAVTLIAEGNSCATISGTYAVNNQSTGGVVLADGNVATGAGATFLNGRVLRDVHNTWFGTDSGVNLSTYDTSQHIWAMANTGTITYPSGATMAKTQSPCLNDGTNCGTRGTATLVAGTVTVSNSAACSPSSSCTYSLSNCGAAGTVGTLSVGAITVGTSFAINSSSATDTSTVCWRIN